MKIYVHHNCSSCKKALKWLAENNLTAETINLLEATPTAEEFAQMTAAYGGNLKKLFNTSGKVYRELNIKEKVSAMTADEVYALLGKEAMLVKRPFLLTAEKGLVGFKEAAWEEAVKDA